MRQGSMFGQRGQVVWTLRVGAHLDLALRGRPGRPRLADVLLAAGAVTVDGLVRRWLERDPHHHAVARTLIDTVEAVAWSHRAGPSETRGRWVQVSHVVAPGLEAGYRLGAGLDALPVPVPPRPWPPRGRHLVRAVAEVAGPVGLPLVAVRAVRRRAGWSWSGFELVWGPLAVVSSAGLARYRARLQGEAAATWQARAADQVAIEEEAATASAAIRSSPGHDFKKTLTALGWAGSERARRAGWEQVGRPGAVTAGSSGTTLLRAALGIPLVPPSCSEVWISAEQRAVLDAFVDEVDARLEDRGPAPVLEVLSVEGLDLHLRYRGEDCRLENPPPRLDAALDPLVPTLLVAALGKALAALHPQVRTPLVLGLGAAAGDVANAIAYGVARASRRPRRVQAAVALAVLTAAAFDAGVVRARLPGRGADGEDVTPATGAALGLLGVLGTCRDDLGPAWRAALVAVAVGQWCVTSLVGYRRSPSTLVREGIAMWQAYAASSGLRSAIAAEAHHLEAALQHDAERRVRQARAAAEAREVHRFEGQLVLAEQELEAVRARLDPAVADFVAQQCQDLRRWIEDRRAGRSRGS